MLTLVPGEVGGTETYARSLMRALAEHGTLDYVAFVPPVAPDAADGVRTVVVSEYRRARTMRERLAAMTLAAVRPGPLRRRIGQIDAIHFPLTIPLPTVSVPTAVTLHDLQHRDHPALFPRAERVLRRVWYERPAKRAAAVIVPSEFVRESVVSHLGIPRERVRVVYHGVDRSRVSAEPRGEREPFLLYPARPWPHKNHRRLFDAFALLREERPELELVLTGGGHQPRPLPPGVVSRGLVSDEELGALYRRAACLVFPSLYEGFGAPPLEAMASGCPVAAARAGSLPEICGDAARLFDPYSPDDIAAAVRDVLDDPEPWIRRGYERSERFSWAESARGHEAVYRRLL